MKVIFLDIDGVLNTKETYDRIYRNSSTVSIFNVELDNFRLEYLKEIIDKTDAKIVLSSSFRNFFAKENEKIVAVKPKGKRIQEMFTGYGIDIYDVTPPTMDSREDEIKSWLSNRDNVESFIIIDDDPSMFFDLRDKLVQTSKIRQSYLTTFMKESTGLCERHIPEVIDRLNIKTKVLKK